MYRPHTPPWLSVACCSMSRGQFVACSPCSDLTATPHTVYAPYKTGSGSAFEVSVHSGHQERPKAFPMAHMNRMVIAYKHTVQWKRL